MNLSNPIKIIERGAFHSLTIEARRAILKNLCNDFKIWEYQALVLCVKYDPKFKVWNDNKSAFCSTKELNAFFLAVNQITI